MNTPRHQPLELEAGWQYVQPGDTIRPGDQLFDLDAGEWTDSRKVGIVVIAARFYRRRVEASK